MSVPGRPLPEGHDAQTRRLFVVAQGDRVEPVRHVIVGCRHEVGDAGLGRAPGARQDREGSAVAGRGIPAGLLARVRASPVERLVGPVADRRERHEAPADDPVGDLEAAADVDDPVLPGREQDLVAGQRLAGRQDPADGRAGQPFACGIAPAVRKVGDHQVARPAVPPEVDA